jgi:hypothetical protein
MSTYVTRIFAVIRRSGTNVLCATRRACSAFAEFNRQQRRYTEHWLAQDIGHNAPDTYAEFLCRARGPLRHEPSARARLDGHPVH